MATVMNIKATSESLFNIGISSTAVSLKNNAGVLELRNKADSAFIDLKTKDITASGVILGDELKTNSNSITLNNDAAGAGADWTMLISRPSSGMSASVTYTLPASPTNGYFLTTDGSGNMSWGVPSLPGQYVQSDVISVGFADFASSPLSFFTLPANAVVDRVEVYISSVFDAGTLEVGISGDTGKFMTSGQNDLLSQARYIGEPLVAVSGSTQSIIVSLSGSPTVGSCSVICYYSVPA